MVIAAAPASAPHVPPTVMSSSSNKEDTSGTKMPSSNTMNASTSSSSSSSSSSAPFSKEDHRDLVHAIFVIGIKESSPLSLMGQMSERAKTSYKGLNLERIKSKLQKYRKKKVDNIKEFMDVYDDKLSDFCAILPSAKHSNHHNSYQQYFNCHAIKITRTPFYNGIPHTHGIRYKILKLNKDKENNRRYRIHNCNTSRCNNATTSI